MERSPAEGPGAILASRRNELGLSLQDVGAITRLTPRTLSCLEAEEWDSLPAPAYIKGFLRSYAKVLGLDPEDMVSRYLAMHKVPEPQGPARVSAPARRKRISLVLILALAGAVILWIALLLASPDRDAANEDTAGSSRDMVTLGRPVAAGPAQAPAEEKGPSMVLDVLATEETWIKANMDERPQVKHQLAKGERIVLTATKRFNLLVGDANSIRLELDGQPVPVTGPPGQAVNVRIPQR